MASEKEMAAASAAITNLVRAGSAHDIKPWQAWELARGALRAAEIERDKERRASCTHQRRRGSGVICSSGASAYEWFCLDCGASGKSETPARPKLSGWDRYLLQN